MRLRSVTVTLSTALLLVVVVLPAPIASAGAVNLFANGDFEASTGNFPDNWVASTEECYTTPWLSESGGIVSWSADPGTFNWPAYSGAAVWLNGCGRDSGNPWYGQDVTVVVGETYQVMGKVRTGYSVTTPYFSNFRVCLDDCAGANILTVDIDPNASAGTWVDFKAKFTAASTSVRVKFVGEFIADYDYLVDHVALTVDNSPAQITDGLATCDSVFNIGEYPSMESIAYTAKRGSILQVNPGVFYYWAKVNLRIGGGSVVTQSANNGWTRWFAQASGSQLFTIDCKPVKGSRLSTESGTTSVTGAGIVAGDYYLAVKFSPSSLVGINAPALDPTITFSSSAGPSDVLLGVIRK